jgi:hypothetical protein
MMDENYGMGPEPQRTEGDDHGVGLCLSCIAEYQMALQDKEAGVLHNGQEPVIPAINFAVTMAPSWQQTQMMGQIVMACVAVPSCMGHLNTEKKSPIQRATASGLAIGGAN